MKELEALIVLNRLPRLGSVKIRTLMQTFGSAEALMKAPLQEMASLFGFSLSMIERIKTDLDKKIWLQELELAIQTGTTLIPFTSPKYPKRLLEIPDFPIILYVQGDKDVQDQPCLAIVGTRRASIYGLEIAERLGRELSNQGFTIVSGLARGIDTAAHQGALKGGRTIAVLGSGLCHLYPKENGPLSEAIKQQGAVISEFAMDAPPNRHHFPQRNRVVSGMTLGTLVIEAPLKSGAMLTAERAAAQGRPVFALPGRADHDNYRGNHLLIKENKAHLVETSEDILKFFAAPPSLFAKMSPAGSPLGLEKEEEELLKKMPIQESSIEELERKCPGPIAKLNGLLMSLVLKKMIKEYPGKIYKKLYLRAVIFIRMELNMGKSLIIVESPAKIKTLKKFLGPNYIFESSVGHIRDLPEKEFGIDIEHDFEPKYTIMPNKEEVIAN